MGGQILEDAKRKRDEEAATRRQEEDALKMQGVADVVPSTSPCL